MTESTTEPPNAYSAEDESVLIRRADAVAAIRQANSGPEALALLMAVDLAGIDRPRLVPSNQTPTAAPYPSTSDAVNSRPTPGVDDTDPRTYPLDPRGDEAAR